MLKYTTTEVTFREIPDEITLCINISNCPIKCPDCHSKELWGDIGEELSPEVLKSLVEQNKGISCVCFMGGDSDIITLHDAANYIKKYYPELKTAWYSGRKSLEDFFTDCIVEHWSIHGMILVFDYMKFGPYIKELGGLDNTNTNQRLYQIYQPNMPLDVKDYFSDITYKFWK